MPSSWEYPSWRPTFVGVIQEPTCSGQAITRRFVKKYSPSLLVYPIASDAWRNSIGIAWHLRPWLPIMIYSCNNAGVEE
jgi:hypothetical protein